MKIACPQCRGISTPPPVHGHAGLTPKPKYVPALALCVKCAPWAFSQNYSGYTISLKIRYSPDVNKGFVYIYIFMILEYNKLSSESIVHFMY